MRAAREAVARPPGKAPTGIAGFDDITGGGLPRGRTTRWLGGPGSGKTVFALEFLVHGTGSFEQPGIFVAFEETSKRILANAHSFDWGLDELQRGKLSFIDAQPAPDMLQSGDFDLGGMLAALQAMVERTGARRIVFDALDVVLALLADRGRQAQGDLSSARLAARARADRNRHRQGRRRRALPCRQGALRLHAVHGGLRGDPQA